ncbi:hypothetical protein M1446_00005 [Candidatus Dependentiae bacterium]|nr:hypothetical protein [Candidatus Dependentiae bacterium]
MKTFVHNLLLCLSASTFSSLFSMEQLVEFGTHANSTLRKSDPIEISQKLMFGSDLAKRKAKLRRRIEIAIEENNKEEIKLILEILEDFKTNGIDLKAEQTEWLNKKIKILNEALYKKNNDPVNYLTQSVIDTRTISEQVEANKKQKEELEKLFYQTEENTKKLLDQTQILKIKIQEKETKIQRLKSENASQEKIDIEVKKLSELKEAEKAISELDEQETADEVADSVDSNLNQQQEKSCTIV